MLRMSLFLQNIGENLKNISSNHAGVVQCMALAGGWAYGVW